MVDIGVSLEGQRIGGQSQAEQKAQQQGYKTFVHNISPFGIL